MPKCRILAKLANWPEFPLVFDLENPVFLQTGRSPREKQILYSGSKLVKEDVGGLQVGSSWNAEVLVGAVDVVGSWGVMFGLITSSR